MGKVHLMLEAVLNRRSTKERKRKRFEETEKNIGFDERNSSIWLSGECGDSVQRAFDQAWNSHPPVVLPNCWLGEEASERKQLELLSWTEGLCSDWQHWSQKIAGRLCFKVISGRKAWAGHPYKWEVLVDCSPWFSYKVTCNPPMISY